jgi:hypothetical protein
MSPDIWLSALLADNGHTAYLRQYGSPRTADAFRARVPLCRYEDLAPWIARIVSGEPDVLFAGRPVAFERTGGNSGGAKLIPYSAAGLRDFQRNLGPWVEGILRDYDIRGSVYFATSPAARAPESIGGIPVGLPDSAYLGEALGAKLAALSVISPALLARFAQQSDLALWRRDTVAALLAARDLELISVWSPTFLLRLLDEMDERDEIPAPQNIWPRLKLISCWTSGASRLHAQVLAERLPQARIQAKGLLSTEAVVSVPDAAGCAVPVTHGFSEFIPLDATGQPNGEPVCVDALCSGACHEVVLTTASGLYRYRSGDRVRVGAQNAQGKPILEFIGRGSLYCDLVGEKLEEAFVAKCLSTFDVETLLIPDFHHPGYVLVSARPLSADALNAVEQSLAANPQYAYARALGQLAPLRPLIHPRPQVRVEEVLLQRGQCPGNIKATALRPDEFWLAAFGETGTHSRTVA